VITERGPTISCPLVSRQRGGLTFPLPTGYTWIRHYSAAMTLMGGWRKTRLTSGYAGLAFYHP